MILGCNEVNVPNRTKEAIITTKEKVHKEQVHSEFGHIDTFCKLPVNSSCGVITINENIEFTDGFTFKVYNTDSTLWKNLRFSPTLINEPNINPNIFDYDNYIMVFKCVGKKGSFYRILIDEKKQIEKLISVQEKNLIFQTWPQHILSVFSVDFDYKKNPLRNENNIRSRLIRFNKEELYRPLKIIGDWLQVGWGDDENLKKGWIKWIDNDTLLVHLFYTA